MNGRPLEDVSICVLANSTLTFHERFSLEVDALRDAGARLIVATRWPEMGAGKLGMPCHTLPAPLADRIGYSTANWRPRRIASNIVRNAARRVAQSAMGRRYDEVRWARTLQQLAASVGVDVFWVLDYENLASAVEAASRSGARVVYETIDLVPEYHHLGRAFQRRARRQERSLIGLVDGFITACDSYADYYEERYGDVPGFRRPVVHDNVPRTRVRSIRPSGQRLDFLFLGALTFDRPIVELIEACALANGGFTLTFQGENYLGAAPQQLVDTLGLHGTVRILPPCEGHQVVETASAYDVGVVALSGLNENERWAATSKLFTYMAAGLAVLGSDLPGIARVIGQHNNGRLVGDSTPAVWAAAFDAMVEAPGSDIDEMKQRSLEAAALYSWERQRDTFIAEFVRALEPR